MKACAIRAIVVMTTMIVVMFVVIMVVRIGRRILRTSPFGDSQKFAYLTREGCSVGAALRDQSTYPSATHSTPNSARLP
jgi:hypothetical protein